MDDTTAEKEAGEEAPRPIPLKETFVRDTHKPPVEPPPDPKPRKEED